MVSSMSLDLDASGWKMLPKEYGSGITSHRRIQEWNKLDVFKKSWVKLLKIYDKEMGINWT